MSQDGPRPTPLAAALKLLRNPYLLLATAMLLWAGNSLLGRAMRAEVTPVGLAFWRWLVALCVLLPFTARELWARRAVIRRHWRLLALCGVLGSALFNTLLYLALAGTTATNVALLYANVPIVIAFIAGVFLREPLSLRQAAGIAVSMLGVGAIITRGDPAVLAELELNRGDLWALAAVPVWAVYTVLLRQRPGQLPPFPFLTVLVVAGLCVLFPAYLWEVATGRAVIAFTPATVATVLYLGVFASVTAFFLWISGVPQVGPSKAGLFTHLYPLFTALLAVIFLGERLHLYHGAGVALIATGLYLTTATPRRRT